MITDPGFNYIGGLSVLTIKNGVDIRFDPNVRMCLDVDFYYSMLLKYGEPILHHDVLIANRVRDDNTLMADVSEEETLQEFDYVHKKFGIKK